MPQWYRPSGAELPSTIPAVENFTFEMADRIDVTLKQHPINECTVQRNLDSAQRQVLQDFKEGKSQHCFLQGDKERIFLAVDPPQLDAVRAAELSKTCYARVDCIPFALIVNEGQKLMADARATKAFSNEELKWCASKLDSRREPVLNIQAKTHKKLSPLAPAPVKTRAIIDTVDFVTKPVATFIASTMTRSVKQIPSHVQDTTDAINKIEATTVPTATVNGRELYLDAYDICEHFPEAPREECNAAYRNELKRLQVELARANLLGRMEAWVTNNVYFKSAIGTFHHMVKGYGIGLDHSREVTDLEWACREAQWLQLLTATGLPLPHINLRMVDDGFIAIYCTEEEHTASIALLQSIDPRRTLTVESSKRSVQWLDLTIHKGPRYASTGILDLDPFRKPTSKGMVLARTSHHPDSTFISILQGEAQRILRLSSSRAAWQQCLAAMHREYTARGYTATEVLTHLCNDEYGNRQGLLSKERATTADSTAVVALKLPYTPRGEQLQLPAVLQALRARAMENPQLRRLFQESRWLIANLKTSNLRAKVRAR